jgi:hypothetical protein
LHEWWWGDTGNEASAVWSCGGDYSCGAPFTTSFFMDPSVTLIGGPARTQTQTEIAATFKGVPLDFDFDTS